MAAPVLWREHKGFSGCLVRGVVPIVAHDPAKHLSCAAWLASQVEGPSYGYVQSYDGAGISAGLLHNVLVYPRDMTPGDLGLLVRKLLDAMPNDGTGANRAAVAFEAEMKTQGWLLPPDGKFRLSSGEPVSGAALRAWAAPPDGRAPRSGPEWDQAVRVALLFHDLFSAAKGWKAQEDFAIGWLSRGNRAAELEVYRTFVRRDLDSFADLSVLSLPPEVHVAMSVYHSFSVNSPAVAAKCLESVKALATRPNHVAFSKALVRELALHGRDVWRDVPGDGRNRYDRTRVAVWRRSDLFPGGSTLMPLDL